MTFEPITPAVVETIRARMPADHPTATHPAHVEGPTAAQLADRLYAAGYRAAAAAGTDAQLATAIVRALADTGIRLGDALDRPRGLDAVRAALKRRVARAIADGFDPEHIAAVEAEGGRPARAGREA